MSEVFARAFSDMVHRACDLSETLAPRFPLFLEQTGTWNTTTDGNWCAGYWIGLQFLAGRHARRADERERLYESARAGIELMRLQPTRNIFAGVNHHVAGFWSADATGDETLKEVGLIGAIAMRDLYDPARRQIPIGMVRLAPFDESNPEHAPLDNLMDVAAVDVIHTSLPILWRAAAESGERSYFDVAVAHARRHLELHCREDGSTIQMTRLDAAGEPIERLNPLGQSLDTCWSRGLAWNIAGLAEAYAATRMPEFLDGLERAVAYFSSAGGGVPSWDLSVPDGPRDSSAAAIIAYGLLKLGADCPQDTRAARLALEGRAVLRALVDECLEDGGLRHGCYRYPQGVAVDTECIWGDFYVMAALDLALQPVPECASALTGWAT